MSGNPLEGIGINRVTAIEPIGEDQAEQGSPEGPPAESHDLTAEQYPEDRYVIEDLNEEKGGNPNDQESIEGPSGRSLVLISIKQQQVGEGRTDADDPCRSLVK